MQYNKDQNLVVKKFGGTSIADTQKIENVARIIKKSIQNGERPIVIVSAMAGVTNQMLTMVDKMAVGMNYSSRFYDSSVVLSSGEQITVGLLSIALQKIGIYAITLLGWQIPIKTFGQNDYSFVKDINASKIKAAINDNKVPVIAGFQGIDENDRITTLGRGGSDITAMAIAAAIQADRCDIYKDIDGIYKVDPSIYKNSKKIDRLSYDEIIEMSSNGMIALHKRAAIIAKKYQIKTKILSTFDNDGNYTMIDNKSIEGLSVSSINHSTDNLRLKIYNIKSQKDGVKIIKELSQIVKEFEYIETNEFDNNFIMEYFCLKKYNEKITKAMAKLQTRGVIRDFDVNSKIAKIAIIGIGIKNHQEHVLNAMDIGSFIRVYKLHTTANSIELFIDEKNIKECIEKLYKKFFKE